MRVLAIPGSYRTGSWNRKLLALAVTAARAGGADVDVVDLRELALPVYDGDLEANTGFPAAAQDLRVRIRAAQGLLIASPEYNFSIPGGLKNAIDWASRPPEQPFARRVVALLGASAGGFGAVRASDHLRTSLSGLGVIALPGAVLVPRAADAFDATGALVEPRTQRALEAHVAAFLELVRTLHPGA